MTDEQREGMDPDEGYRKFTEDQPLDQTVDTEGHGRNPLTADPEAGTAIDTEEGDQDTEGHRAYSSDRNLKRDITPVRW